MGTFSQFHKAAPRVSDERAEERMDPERCYALLQLLDSKMEQSGSLGWLGVLATAASALLPACTYLALKKRPWSRAVGAHRSGGGDVYQRR